MRTLTVNLKFYAILSQDGKWFRARGMNGTGSSWTDDIKNAKVYSKPGPARGIISWWHDNYPTFGIPQLVELPISEANVIDESERVQKTSAQRKQKEHKRVIEQKKREIEALNRSIARQEQQMEDERNKLKNLESHDKK